ncbi:YwqJ-related putative deaminase [Streptomyces sp. NPDC047046]|uniref:YwqJ-related putative deaminase n=1 Tax=Streptomyces sp. NPDC047046 TaxID=3155378 RepID=UPI0033FBC47C
MHTAQPGPEATAHTAPEAPTPPGPRTPRPSSLLPAHDPRVDWSHDGNRPPALRHRRDGILPAVAAALSVRGTTLTGTGARGDQPPALHPLVQDFLDTLTSDRRERFTGRCAEAVLLSRHLTEADTARTARSKRAARRPMTPGEARKALKGAKLTTRHIREDGDPLHGAFAPPCRSCTALAEHFGVTVIDPTLQD